LGDERRLFAFAK